MECNKPIVTYGAFIGNSPIKFPFIVIGDRHSRYVKLWSQVDEMIHFLLNSLVENMASRNDFSKHEFISSQLRLSRKMSSKNNKIYDTDYAFTWCSMSRKLYLQLRKYLFLPSLRTLQNLTAKVSHISSGELLKHFFKNQD